MSGGASKKKSARVQGWEEAGGEFYQESYPSTEVDFEAFHKDPSHLATLLPSKQTRAGMWIYLLFLYFNCPLHFALNFFLEIINTFRNKLKKGINKWMF